MVLNIELPKETEDALRLRAQKQGLSLEDFALRMLLQAATDVDDATFRANLKKSIAKNDELLKRLS